MGHAILYCSNCGERVLERDMSKGSVLVAQGNHFCPACVATAPPGAKPLVPLQVETPTEIRRSGPSSRPPTSRHAAIPRPAAPASKVPFLIGAGIVVIMVIVAVALFSGGGGTERDPGPGPGPGAKTPAKDGDISNVKVDKYKEATERFTALKAFRDANTASPQAIIDRVNAEMPKYKDSPFETEATLILREAETAKERSRLETTVDGLIAKAKEAQGRDPSYKERQSVLGFFKEARPYAEKHGATLSLKVLTAEQDYESAFQVAARNAADPLVLESIRLADQEKWDDATAVLDRYPPQYRDTVEGRRVAEEKKKVLERKQIKESEPTIANDFNGAHESLRLETADGYKEAADRFSKVLEALKNQELVRRQGITPAQVRSMRSNANYNIACWYSRFVKNKEKTFEHLEASFAAGWSQWSHIETDKDLDTYRADAKFKELIEKYRKPK